MTPHDELMALAGKWDLRSDPHSGKCAADLRALLDSDAFRAMVRDAADARRYRWLKEKDLFDPESQPAELSYAFSRYTGEMLDAAIDAAASGAGGS